MSAGIRVKLTLLVPCNPKDMGSLAAASQKAMKLTTLAGLRTIADDVVIEDSITTLVSKIKDVAA